MNAEIITSEAYTRQKKRNNFYIHLNDGSLGKIKYFLLIQENLFSVTQKLEIDVQSPTIYLSRLNIDFSRYFMPFRETYTIEVIPVRSASIKEREGI